MFKGRGSEFGDSRVHPSAYDNRRTRSCPKINVQLCKRNESLLIERNDI